MNKPKLELAVVNTDKDIMSHKLDREILIMSCGRCYHRWRASIGDICDNPKCPRCDAGV